MTNPILRDVPGQLESERLLIRCPRPGDGAVHFEAVVETLAELRTWSASLPWSMNEPSIEASEIFCREGALAYAARRDFPMLLFLKEDGRFVGSSGLHRFDWSVPKFEVGYWCRKSRHGQGFVTEAVQAITAFAFSTLGAHRVESFPDEGNTPSRAVCERAGYRLEGTMRNERVDADGRLRNTCIYARYAP